MEQESPTRMATTSNHSTHTHPHTRTSTHAHKHAHTHVPAHTCTHTPAHMPTHTPTRTRTHAHTHAPAHMHQHTCTHTHAPAHMHQHTRTPSLGPGACWDLPEPPLCKRPSKSLDWTAVSSVGLFPLPVQGKLGPARNHSAGNRRWRTEGTFLPREAA